MRSKIWRPLRWQKKKPSTPPAKNVQLVSNLYRSTKALLRGRDDYIVLDQCPKYIFQLWFGGRSGSCILDDKKAKNESSGALHAT